MGKQLKEKQLSEYREEDWFLQRDSRGNAHLPVDDPHTPQRLLLCAKGYLDAANALMEGLYFITALDDSPDVVVSAVDPTIHMHRHAIERMLKCIISLWHGNDTLHAAGPRDEALVKLVAHVKDIARDAEKLHPDHGLTLWPNLDSVEGFVRVLDRFDPNSRTINFGEMLGSHPAAAGAFDIFQFSDTMELLFTFLEKIYAWIETVTRASEHSAANGSQHRT